MLNRLRALSALLVLLAAGTPALAQTTVVLQQGLNSYAGAADNWIIWSSGADTNKGGLVELDLRSTSDYGLVRFSIFQSEGGPVPNGATITSATLSLYKFWGPDAVFRASRLLKPWTEMGSTWNSTGSALWSTPGAQGAGSDVLATADGQGSIGDAVANGCNTVPNSGPFPAACWLNIDVTAGVQAFSSGASANNGWLLQQVSSSAEFNYKNFNSREFATVGGRPQLTITYTGGTAPTAPTARLTAAPTVGTGPLAVTFDASTSTDGGSPITGLRLQFGDGTPDATWTDKNAPIPPHTYAAASTSYTVSATLIVSNAVGSSTSAPVQITVNPSGGTTTGPTARLSVDHPSGTTPLTVTFDATATTQGTGAITQLRLAFDDGSTDWTWTDKTQPIPAHTYVARPTPYNAVLTVTDANNLTSTSSVQVSVTDGSDLVPGEPAAGPAGLALPTFHSMSLYYNPPSAPANGVVWMRYRRASESAWRQGWPLWYDPRGSADGPLLPYSFRARGAAVYLQPGTKYYFEFGIGADYASVPSDQWVYVSATTWPDPLQEDPNRTIVTQTTPFSITAGGAEGALKVYDGQGVTINGGGTASSCIFVNADFVILRNFKVTACHDYGIAVAANRHHVVIEDSEISDWDYCPGGTFTGWSTNGCNEFGGIQLNGANSQIVIQRNKIHDPQLGANPWDFGHPIGPMAVMMVNAGQQNVIRYNEIYSTLDDHHWVQDGISGTDNFSAAGAPGADSDIYGNNIRNIMDDGVEAEGGGRNVRVWGNYVDAVGGSGIATTIAHYGPIYMFRNVVNRERKFHTRTGNTKTGDNGIAEPDDDEWDRGMGFKCYGHSVDDSGVFWGGGRQYFFNNTILQQPKNTYNPAQIWGDLGAATGLSGGSHAREGLDQTWSRNNILDIFRPTSDNLGGRASSIELGNGPTSTNDFNFDLSSGFTSGELNGIDGRPTYKAGHGWNAGPNFTYQGGVVGLGNFQLDASSLGLAAGTPLPNFTTDIDNTVLAAKSGVQVGPGNPDMGAHQNGAPAMKFGISAGQ